MRVVTHSGDFHADEVFAVATLALFYGREHLDIVRSRDPETVAHADIVVDVGYVYDPAAGRFDHHQEGGAGARENGIPYSSFGLVWKEYGERLCGDREAARAVEEKVVYPIDAADNAMEVFVSARPDVFPYLFHNMIAALRPTWKELDQGIRTADQGFFEALDIAEKVLTREVLMATHLTEGFAHARKIHEDSTDHRILLLEENYPWYTIPAECPDLLFVVKPDQHSRGVWKVHSVRENAHSFKNRKDLPASWAGKTREALREVTGVTDALFCHVQRFIATAGSREGALSLARIAADHQ